MHAINGAFINGHLRSLIVQYDFVKGIRDWPKELTQTAIRQSIAERDFIALTKILDHSPRLDVDFKILILQAKAENRLDMVVELAQSAKHVDPRALEYAFHVITTHENADFYLELLLIKTKGALDGYHIFMKFLESAIMKDDMDQIEIFLEHLDYAWTDNVQSIFGLPPSYELQILNHMIAFSRSHNSNAIDLLIFKMLELSQDFPQDVGEAIILYSSAEHRITNFKYFLHKIKEGRVDADSLLFGFLGNLALDGDMELIQVFFGNDKYLRIKTLFKMQEENHISAMDGLMDRYPNPSYWMIVNAILRSADSKQEATMKFLISKMTDVTAAGNMILTVAVINGKYNLVKELLRNDQIVESPHYYDWIDFNKFFAKKYEHFAILELLETVSGMKPQFHFAAPAA